MCDMSCQQHISVAKGKKRSGGTIKHGKAEKNKKKTNHRNIQGEELTKKCKAEAKCKASRKGNTKASGKTKE